MNLCRPPVPEEEGGRGLSGRSPTTYVVGYILSPLRGCAGPRQRGLPMRSRTLRLAVPASLALLGAGLLSGCLFIPTFNATIEGKNVAGEVGDADSRKPARVDHATIQDVYRVLGPPQFATDDG